MEYKNGKIWDSYESVTNGWNTYARLDLEFSREIDRIMKEELPYEINMVVASLISKDNFENFDIPLDAKLDMTKPYGIPTLSVYVYDNNKSWEDVAKLALKSKEIMEKHNIPIEEYSCQISPPKTGEESKDWYEYVGFHEAPKDMIVDTKDLPEILKAHQEAREKEWDKEKFSDEKQNTTDSKQQ